MRYQPTLADAAVDFYRAVNCSLGPDGFADKNALIFFENAQRIFKDLKNKIPPSLLVEVEKSLVKSQDTALPLSCRQEHLLMVSSLLL